MPVYIYTTLVGPPGSSGALPNGINNQGQIVGSYNDGSGSQGFLLSAGTYTTLNDPSAVTHDTTATGINASGQIVGIYNPLLGQRGFLYNNGTYSTIDTGTTTTAVMGINAASQIVGYDFNIIFSVHVIYTRSLAFSTPMARLRPSTIRWRSDRANPSSP